MEATHLSVVKDSPVPREEQEGFSKDLPGGLPVYLNPTIEGVESTWTHLDAQDDEINFKRGAVAHVVSVERIYGEANLREFSAKMKFSYSTALDWMGTYRRLLRLSDAARERVMNLDLRYSHYRALNGVNNDGSYEALLLQAHKKGWHVGKLMKALYDWKKVQSEASKPLSIGEPPEFRSYIESGTGEVPDVPDPERKIQAASLPALDSVGADYERDVIERFTDWLQDKGLVLVDEYGEVSKFYVIVEKYANERL